VVLPVLALLQPLRSLTVGLLAWATALGCLAADGAAIAGIVEGSVTLVRQTTRYTLAEGVALRPEDIVETAPGAFVQIEFEDGAIVGLGEGSRVILQPRLARLKPETLPRLYLLEGWVKVTPAAKPGTTFNFLTARLEVGTQSATVVTLSRPNEYVMFVESGTARLNERDGARASLSLKAGDFASRAPGAEKPAVRTNVPADFLSRMPRFYRDRLPARAAVFAKRNIAPKQQDAVAYADVTHWLHAEPAIRLPLSRQWRSRATDKRFRAEIVANLSAHMEWEPVVFPERFIKKDLPASAPATGSAATAPAALAK
jgi:hypothetical protein